MFGKSLMYIKKSNGPRTEPCGTPQLFQTNKNLILYNVWQIINVYQEK